MATRKPKSTEDDLINKWLGDYHGTSLAKVIEENPKWLDNPHKHTRDFYKKYAVTQAQHDEWRKWMIDTIAKEYRMSKKAANRASAFIYLNTAPNVTKDGSGENTEN